MTTFDSIRLTAYQPDRDAGAFTQGWFGLAFPARWRKLFLEHYRLHKRDPDRCQRVPIGRLNEVIRAVAPDLVSVARGATENDASPWIYARDRFPVPLLRQMILAWIYDMHREETDPDKKAEIQAATTRLVAELDFSELSWDPEPVDLLARSLNADGTAEPDGRLYQLLPDELAKRAVSLSELAGAPVDINRLTAALVGRVLLAYERFVDGDHTDAFVNLWNKFDVLRGREVTLSEAGRKRRGRVIGVDDVGSLVLRDEHGRTRSHRAGEVTIEKGG